MKILNLITLTSTIWIMVFVTTSCSVTPEEYKNETPVFDLASYFNGNVEAWGIFQDYSGKVIKRFNVKMIGTWSDNRGILDERFTYSDGTTQRRIWRLQKIDDNNYTGTADDVVGVATGIAHGNALQWKYTMALTVDGETYHVQFDDWMYLVDKDTVINRSIMKKLGVSLGEVTLFFKRNEMS